MPIFDALQAIDLKLFSLINALADQGFVFNDILIFYAHYYPLFLFLIILTDYFYLSRNNYRTVKLFYQMLIAVILCGGVKFVIGLFYFRSRPFLLENIDITVLLSRYSLSSSFPSGHTLVSFALITSAYFYNKKLAVVLSIFSLIGGILRIFGGVHYPFDILGGILGGIIAGMLANRLLNLDIVKKGIKGVVGK